MWRKWFDSKDIPIKSQEQLLKDHNARYSHGRVKSQNPTPSRTSTTSLESAPRSSAPPASSLHNSPSPATPVPSLSSSPRADSPSLQEEPLESKSSPPNVRINTNTGTHRDRSSRPEARNNQESSTGSAVRHATDKTKTLPGNLPTIVR